MDKSKRTFCTRYLLRQIGRAVEGFEEGLREAQEKLDFDDFFESYESSYALTLAYPDDILMATAHRHGIDTENREKREIVKELFEKHGDTRESVSELFSK